MEKFDPALYEADCENCAAICCVLTEIHGPTGTITKESGEICEHLDLEKERCNIY